ncbi:MULTISPECIES: hypothetical protein [Nostocales]|uniref:Uncharacterized protein n=2 Tax=Nostocales TaxID=1161 RepID=A0A0C1R442_9CYAN|nr:hypothetical protein [Tolypothrix bouteillei]KAF3886474.1 hypothetical protein DA73_0400014040 [Tolypothrix bouteillei VB521301]
MSKFLSVSLLGIALFLGGTHHNTVTLAGTCASNCGRSPIEFTPGQHVRVEVINATPRILKVEKPYGLGQIPLRSGQQIRIEQGDGTEPNISVVFWDDTGRPLKAIVSKPNFATLRVELRPSWQSPGDRSVYIRDDGRVNIF